MDVTLGRRIVFVLLFYFMFCVIDSGIYIYRVNFDLLHIIVNCIRYEVLHISKVTNTYRSILSAILYYKTYWFSKSISIVI